MIKLNYLLAAKDLLDRSENRLNTERAPEEKETEEMFYWVLDKLERSIRFSLQAEARRHSVAITIPSNRIILKDGIFGEGYIPKYVCARDDFLAVVQNVVDIFNEVGSVLDNRFSAELLKSKKTRCQIIYIYMTM